MVLADATVLDTEDPASVAAFWRSHGELLQALARMGAETRADTALADRIRHKYRIKNTTGYSLNALVDFEDPVDILAHLMIGSEGTLGFISRITYRTVADDPCKASALVFFPTLEHACQAVLGLRPLQVSAVELLDRASLRSVQEQPGMPAAMRTLADEAAALLIEVRAQTEPALQLRMDAACGVLSQLPTVEPAAFATDPTVCDSYLEGRARAPSPRGRHVAAPHSRI